ncbi:MAG TPA: hypothetical protein ENI90_04980 [Methylothermaceae bacterium]|nr:hypothetical protein [Methylothermaceae bacterium]
MRILLFWSVWSACFVAGEALAQPRLEQNDCLVATDFYIVHFTAFQPPAAPPRNARERRQAFQRYCRELPRTGTTYFGIDFIDRDVRDIPITLKVVEEQPDGKASRTLVALPSRQYPRGVAELKVDFDRPGRYALVVEFGDRVELADDRLRIPISVGLDLWHVPWLAIAAALSLVVFFSLISFFILHFRRAGLKP